MYTDKGYGKINTELKSDLESEIKVVENESVEKGATTEELEENLTTMKLTTTKNKKTWVDIEKERDEIMKLLGKLQDPYSDRDFLKAESLYLETEESCNLKCLEVEQAKMHNELIIDRRNRIEEILDPKNSLLGDIHKIRDDYNEAIDENLRNQKEQCLEIAKGLEEDQERLRKAQQLEDRLKEMNAAIVESATAQMNAKLQEQQDLKVLSADMASKIKVQEGLIKQLNDKIKQMQREVDDKKAQLRKLEDECPDEELEAERRGHEEDLKNQCALEDRLQELKLQYQKDLQDHNVEEADERANDALDDTEQKLRDLTTGPQYEQWKNGMIDDDMNKRQQLEDELVRSLNIPGKDPSVTFGEQKDSNIDDRNTWLDKLRSDLEKRMGDEEEGLQEYDTLKDTWKDLRRGKNGGAPSRSRGPGARGGMEGRGGEGEYKEGDFDDEDLYMSEELDMEAIQFDPSTSGMG